MKADLVDEWDYIMVKVGHKYVGKPISVGEDRKVHITTIGQNGCASIRSNIFRRFKDQLYVDGEKIEFSSTK